MFCNISFQREQLQDHETRIVWLEKEYEELVTRTPEKTLKSRFVHEYAEKEAYLQYEVNIIIIFSIIDLK